MHSRDICSMLLIGLFSFLRQTMETELMMGHGDNARNRAFLFSTKMNHYREFVRDMCQCPQSGFPHFYCSKHYLVRILPVGVNALNRAFLISTQTAAEAKQWTLTVSMPSIGLSSFLHTWGGWTNASRSVSMPSIGLSSFLRRAGS